MNRPRQASQRHGADLHQFTRNPCAIGSTNGGTHRRSEFGILPSQTNLIAVRHVSGDEIVAVVEIVSRGNKSSTMAMRSLIEKAAELLFQGVHLLLLDLHPPGPRDPNGIHAVLWNEMTTQVYPTPKKPLTLAAYEASPIGATRAYIQPIDVGDILPEMPLFLRPGAHIAMPLEPTYDRAFAAIPKRWRTVIEKT